MKKLNRKTSAMRKNLISLYGNEGCSNILC